MSVPERFDEIQRRGSQLEHLRSLGWNAAIWLKPEGIVSPCYEGAIQEVEVNAVKPGVKLLVSRAILYVETNESLAFAELLKTLREAREAVVPSASAVEAISADRDLSYALSQEINGALAQSIELEIERGTLKRLLLTDIDSVIGVHQS